MLRSRRWKSRSLNVGFEVVVENVVVVVAGEEKEPEDVVGIGWVEVEVGGCVAVAVAVAVHLVVLDHSHYLRHSIHHHFHWLKTRRIGRVDVGTSL
jgi:sterol desaturase/sphingolipid hydroxylase (fatty acid hydroxylase superfamily)